MSSRAYNNSTMLKALEEVDEDLAIKAVSEPNLNGEELNEIITTSLMGNIVNKKTNEPMKLSNKVLGAAMLNRINQIHNEKIRK